MCVSADCTENASNISRLSESAPSEAGSVTQGILMVYVNDKGEEQTCVICYEEKALLSTKCKHNICMDCLLKMFEYNIQRCGICRQLLVLKR